MHSILAKIKILGKTGANNKEFYQLDSEFYRSYTFILF